jgi:hypothetical protein
VRVYRKPPSPERISTPARAKPAIAQTGKLGELAATGAAAGLSGLFFVVVAVVVGEVAVVGAVVVSRVDVDVEVVRCRRFFGGGAPWSLVVVRPVVVGEVIGAVLVVVTVSVAVVDVVSVDVVSVVSSSAALTVPPAAAYPPTARSAAAAAVANKREEPTEWSFPNPAHGNRGKLRRCRRKLSSSGTARPSGAGS